MKQPPRLAQKIFEFIAGSAHIDDLIGDLDEWFYLNLKTKPLWQARLCYWKQVLSLSLSYAIRKRKRDARFSPYATALPFTDMIKNYIKVAWRNVYQYKYFSILNIFGLAIGMSISLLLISIFSYVSTYDTFHEHKAHIHTVISTYKEGVEEIDYATAPVLLGEKIRNEFSGAKEVVRIVKAYHTEVKTEKENIAVKSYFTESSFLSVFSFPLVQGHGLALDKPNQAILTQSAARKLFNTHDVLGRFLELTDGTTVEVTGLLQDPPANSHLTFEMLLSYNTISPSQSSIHDQWTNYPYQYVYVRLQDASSGHDLQQFLDKTAKEVYEQSPVKVSFDHQPLKDIAMGRDLQQAIGTKWEASGFLLFAVFAALILLPACFNYTNISIARALRRAKEIGLRKTMGGAKRQIFFQFMAETIVIAVLALIGAVLIFVFIREEFKSMLAGGSSLDLSLTWRMVSLFFMFTLITGFIAGFFPALHFAGLNPIQALKSKINTRGPSLRLRKVLTIFQFALSFGFILSLVVFSRQYRYSLNFDFGFSRENIVNVELQDVSPEQFKTRFSQLSPVRTVSMSSGLLGVHSSSTWIRNEENDSTEVAQLFVDPHYINNLGLTLLSGKNFPDEPFTDERYIIINEEFLKYDAIADASEVLGRIYTVEGMELEVIGVLKNFNFAPLTQPISKFFFRCNPSRFEYANLKVTSQDAFQLFTQLENTWKQFPTQKKFRARYFEDDLNEAYNTYVVLLKIIGFLGILAITISLLGMLGMVVYTSETKTKEVSIRKVMGATVFNVTYMLSKDYLKMMTWAIALAIPLTAFVLSLLLKQVQYYTVRLSAFDVIVSMLILLSLGLVTITVQTYRTAMTNPANALRAD